MTHRSLEFEVLDGPVGVLNVTHGIAKSRSAMQTEKQTTVRRFESDWRVL